MDPARIRSAQHAAMQRALFHLLTACPEAPPIHTLEQWWTRHSELARAFEDPAELALVGGFSADRLGYAFASGYQAAAAALFPTNSLPAALCSSLAATEAGGVHPRAIATRLTESMQLEGEKTFVTLGTFAQRFLVVARRSAGTRERPELCVVVIDRRRGVTVIEREPTPFAPEVPHARVILDGVEVAPEEVLPGDGYTAYLKPFRTVEDAHVLAALIGYLVRVGRRNGWPDASLERAIACGVVLGTIARGDPSSDALHVALAGALALVGQMLEDFEPLWEQVDGETRERWKRDRVLLTVAQSARDKRRDAAWRRLRQ
jgi:hypothetical protein